MGIYGDIYKMLTVPPIVNKQKKMGKAQISKRERVQNPTRQSVKMTNMSIAHRIAVPRGLQWPEG